jgi:hypothetical protein
MNANTSKQGPTRLYERDTYIEAVCQSLRPYVAENCGKSLFAGVKRECRQGMMYGRNPHVSDILHENECIMEDVPEHNVSRIRNETQRGGKSRRMVVDDGTTMSAGGYKK